MYGYLRGVVQRRSCPVKVSIKVAESNKQKMVSDLHTARTNAENRIKSLKPEDGAALPAETPSTLPPLQHRDAPRGEGWIEFDKPLLYLYAGKGPFVSRDLMQFPVSHPDDGFIDVVIQETVREAPILFVACSSFVNNVYSRPARRCSRRWTAQRRARTTG